MSDMQAPTVEGRLDAIEAHLARIEALLQLTAATTERGPAAAEKESPVAPWRHLVARRHPWRRQLYLKGRNLTVRQLLGSLRANGLTEEQAAANHDLPVEAVREAVAYAADNAELLELEAAFERYLLARGGKLRGPRPVP